MSLYFKLNAALRGRDEGQLKKYYPYCRLLFGGLSQMLPQRQTVYRALQRLPEAIWAEFFKMQPGDTFAFDTFTSTSTSKKGSLPFLGEKQKDNCRAFFTLEALSAFDIRAFSEFPCEEELMIPPGSRSEVVAVEQVTETEGGGDNIVGGTGLVYQALVNITARQMPLDPTVARCIDSEYSSSTTTQQTQQQPRPPPPQPEGLRLVAQRHQRFRFFRFLVFSFRVVIGSARAGIGHVEGIACSSHAAIEYRGHSLTGELNKQ
jgi:hypothetical protein